VDVKKEERTNRRGDATRARILDVAERLFAAEGFSEVSLRRITTEADANVASVNYYFKTKDALLDAVFVRRIVPINKERIRKLEACISSDIEGEALLECVVRAFVEPHVRMTNKFGPGGTVIMQMLARYASDPKRKIETILMKQYNPIWDRFSDEFAKLLPHLGKRAVYWRFYFLLGALYYLNSGRQWLADCSEGLCDPTDVEASIEQLVPFLVGAMKQPEGKKTV
jgi:AcrR family transcriptional regulator